MLHFDFVIHYLHWPQIEVVISDTLDINLLYISDTDLNHTMVVTSNLFQKSA